MSADHDSDEADEEDGCGVSYEHDLHLIDEANGWRVFECTQCGAEITEGPED